ncbi:MAG: hypothetical protein QY325_04345 [Flavobacteriales bacterium]|nr:MAG: hypothetical protein QY325_04345 [Flavobacteriales bacterium]
MATLLSPNGKPIARVATREEVVASELRQAPMRVGQPAFNVGSVAPIANAPTSIGALDNFTVELQNTCSATQSFIIGDPSQGIAALSGLTLLDPTGCSLDGPVKGSGVAAMKQLFGFRSVSVNWFNYFTSSSALQFNQRMRRAVIEIDGTLSFKPVNIAIQLRNNQFDDLLVTPDMSANPLIFNWNQALIVPVLAGETVTLEMSPGMVA